jgi:hypothetical protein
MPLQISISNAIGSRGVTAAGGFDPDAQAFITDASITNPTQQSAINQLVVDLKGYSIWTKMKALYPFVGGSASSHSYNLRNTAQFQITWNGGITHSSTGVLFGGVNGYGNTNYNLSTNASLNSHHISVYSRSTLSSSFQCELGVTGGVFDGGSALFLRASGTSYYRINSTATYVTYADTDSRAFYMANRTASNVINGWRNSTKVATGTTASATPLGNQNYHLGVLNENGGNNYWSAKQLAFASIGDGLTDTEAANFYTAVQTFQTTLGRSIGTQTVSDADAQAFVTAANIQDQVEATAVNNLTIGLKADGLWTKMKALYPFVGGSSSSHSYNLKNTAQYQITWNGGVTHSSTGVLSNDINGYGNTNLNPSSVLSLNSTHLSYYSRSNTNGSEDVEIGISISGTSRLLIAPKYLGASTAYRAVNDAQVGPGTSPSDMRGLFVASRVSSTQTKLYKNTSTLFTDNINSGSLANGNIFILVYNLGTPSPSHFSSRECAFSSIGDGLSDTEVTNLNSRVTTFQTALNRNI